jgi:hypothetical protein
MANWDSHNQMTSTRNPPFFNTWIKAVDRDVFAHLAEDLEEEHPQARYGEAHGR